MAAVLVTGGTGRLGRVLVPLLLAEEHEVRVLTRRPEPRLPANAAVCHGDVLTGAGVAAAVEGADVVLHAATSSRRRIRATEVEGTRNVAAAARQAGAHLLYLSISGCDRHRFPYYRAKHAAEGIIAGSGAAFTVLRSTQFHELIDEVLRAGVFIRTGHMPFQPVDTGEVAVRLVELAAGPAQGVVADFGGPEILGLRELAATRREVTGHRTRMVRVPAVGYLADFDAGVQLAPDRRTGRRTWREWLTAPSGEAVG
jgi:uncharacterized protein YbjT (DUF2867 family)